MTRSRSTILQRARRSGALLLLPLALTACGPESSLGLAVKEEQLDVAYGAQTPASLDDAGMAVPGEPVPGFPGLRKVPFAPSAGPGGALRPSDPGFVSVPFDPATQVPIGAGTGAGLPTLECPDESELERPLETTAGGFPIPVGTYGYTQDGTLTIGEATYPIAGRLGRIIASLPGKDPVDGHEVQYVVYVYGQVGNITAVIFQVDNAGGGIELAALIQLDPQDMSTGLFSTLAYLPNLPTRVATLPMAYEAFPVQEPAGVSSGVTTPPIPELLLNLLPEPNVLVTGAVATFDGLGLDPIAPGPIHQTTGKRKFFACGKVIEAYDVAVKGTLRVRGGRGALVNLQAVWSFAPQYGALLVREEMRISGVKYGSAEKAAETPYDLSYVSQIEAVEPVVPATLTVEGVGEVDE